MIYDKYLKLNIYTCIELNYNYKKKFNLRFKLKLYFIQMAETELNPSKLGTLE